MDPSNILKKLPFATPFRFVDAIASVDEHHIEGHYTLKKDEHFYAGHFPGNPITPGVILTEIAAQVGLVSFGIYLSCSESHEPGENVVPMFSSASVDFFRPVYPGQLVRVRAKKEYFRFSKLKCSVEMRNDQGELILKGSLSGMIVNSKIE